MFQFLGDHLPVTAALFSCLSTGYANDPQRQKARLAEARRVTDGDRRYHDIVRGNRG